MHWGQYSTGLAIISISVSFNFYVNKIGHVLVFLNLSISFTSIGKTLMILIKKMKHYSLKKLNLKKRKSPQFLPDQND